MSADLSSPLPTRKRGRPISAVSLHDPEAARREQERLRKRRWRAARRAHLTQLAAAPALPAWTPAQDRLLHHVLRPAVQDTQPTPTDPAIGLRIPALNLPSDPNEEHYLTALHRVATDQEGTSTHLSQQEEGQGEESEASGTRRVARDEDRVRMQSPLWSDSTAANDGDRTPSIRAETRHTSDVDADRGDARSLDAGDDGGGQDDPTSDASETEGYDTNGSDEDDEEPHPRWKIAEKMIAHLEGRGLGCTAQQHRDQLDTHLSQVQEEEAQCQSLDAAFQDTQFPSVMQEPVMLPRSKYGKMAQPSVEQWSGMFCGTQGQESPTYVCLHATEEEQVEVETAFDIDSYLGFASSLAFARRGIRYQPAPQYRQNIQTDVHIRTTVPADVTDSDLEDDAPRRMVSANLKDVPHFMLGTLEGDDCVAVYILFPEIGYKGPMFHALTSEQHRKWMNMIFLPSIRDHLPAHFMQHLPGSFDHASQNSYARRLESRVVGSGSYATQQALTYFLPPESLGDIWTAIERRIRRLPEARIFQNAQLFFSAKGTKLRYKEWRGGSTLLRTLRSFLEAFNRGIDSDFVYADRVFVDVGKEVCPRKGEGGRRYDEDEEQSAHMLMWKRCCLKRILNELWDRQDGDVPTAVRVNQQFYSVSMLQDAANCTSAPTAKSLLYQGGMIYMQFYASVKEVIDAAKQYPFQNDGMEEMALDPLVHKAAQTVTKGRKRDLQVIEKAYLSSKRRLDEAVLSSKRKSFGTREEFRKSLSLLREELFILEQRAEAGVDLDPGHIGRRYGDVSYHPATTWAIPTSTYLEYLWRNADKFATGFEMIRARAREERNRISWEYTKTMVMFLRCLRYCLSGYNLAREGALWWGKVEGRDEATGREVRRVGLGFVNTLIKYGYAWIETERVDWSTLTFRNEVTDRILFGNHVLKQAYTRQGGSVHDFFNATRQTETALEYVRELDQFPEARIRAMEWLMHIVLRQFRTDVLGSITEDLADDCQEKDIKEDIRRGEEPFSYDYISSICRPEKMMIMRTQKTTYSTPKKLVAYLLGWQDNLARGFWEDKPFRVLYRQCYAGLKQVDRDLSVQWDHMVRRGMLRWHWLLPYPHARGLTETDKKRARKWYSINLKAGGKGPVNGREEMHDWEMVSQIYRAGHPEPIPSWVAWEQGEWEDWRSQWIGR